MATITVQDLQNIAVKATSDFFNNSIPLNDTLAKEASDRGLNSEQVQRAVEATNTLTHLKMIELASDRTSEFPVAEYKTIIKMASVPASMVSYEDTGVEKTASVNTEAFDSIPTPGPSLTEATVATLIKEASVNEVHLENARIELTGVASKMLEKISSLKGTEGLHDKLSVSSAGPAEYGMLSKVLDVPEIRRDLPASLIKQASLNDVEDLVGLCKQASALTKEIREREVLNQRWVEKKAFISSLGFSLGKGVGAVASLPFKAIGSSARFLGRSVVSAGKAGAKGVNNALSGTRVGKSMGIKPKPIDPIVKKRLSRLSTLGTLGMYSLDSQVFTPKVDPANDHSGKVWDALQ